MIVIINTSNPAVSSEVENDLINMTGTGHHSVGDIM